MKQDQDNLKSQIRSITNQIVNKYKPVKVILFGSAVSGKMTSDSDLDFLIIKDDKRNFHDRVAEIYKKVDKDIAADFIVYTPKEVSKRVQLKDPFITSILQEGKVLYG